ncbi:MAG: phosphonate metabolism protein [Rhizobiales bacterium PAR1]|nr:MAG: phosphonate metabolism protein [Rhizobiales bacterium PAR1]
MSPRYAIYLAPEPGTPLWQLGSALLGYDAATGHDLPFPEVPGIDPDVWRALTEDPRRYGFHLTLKAPFRLADGVTVAGLEEALTAFVAQRQDLDGVRFGIEIRHYADGTGFVCLAPAGPAPDLSALEAAVVPHFDHFRAPLSEQEKARRKPATLPERERHYLNRFGYPFVLDAFRPHFSLTGRHAEPERTASALTEVIMQEPGVMKFAPKTLVLFEQPDSASRFVIRRAFKLGDASKSTSEDQGGGAPAKPVPGSNKS